MKFKYFLAICLGLLSTSLSAQRIIPEEELNWETTYGPAELADVDPDSVYSFYYWGSYGTFEEEEDTVFVLENLLRCRNLQQLVLRGLNNETMEEVAANLNRFPLMQHLELSGANLYEFPPAIYGYKNLTTLVLSYVDNFEPDSAALIGNKIHTLDFDHVNAATCDEDDQCYFRFDWFPSLRSLTLMNSNINKLESIGGCPELIYLEIGDLNVGSVDIDFVRLSNLEILKMSNLYEAYEPPVGLGELKKLTELSIDGVSFDLSESDIGNCTNLVRLVISGTHSTNLNFVGNLSKLDFLSLNSNGLTEVPEGIGNCKLLTSLTLSNNELSKFPIGLFELKSLETLDIEYNQFTSIPSGFSGLTGLGILYASHNPIRKIESGAFKLPKLHILHISHCPLGMLPDEIGNLTALREMSAYDDSISSISPAIFKLANLEYMDLSNNNLTILPSGWSGLIALTWLSIKYNKVSKLPADLFKTINVRTLNLENNQFKTIPKGIVQLSTLKTLYLNHNPHVTLPKGMAKMKDLEYVYLSNSDVNEKEKVKLTKLLGDKLQLTEY